MKLDIVIRDLLQTVEYGSLHTAVIDEGLPAPEDQSAFLTNESATEVEGAYSRLCGLGRSDRRFRSRYRLGESYALAKVSDLIEPRGAPAWCFEGRDGIYKVGDRPLL